MARDILGQFGWSARRTSAPGPVCGGPDRNLRHGQRIAHEFVVAKAQRRGNTPAMAELAAIASPPYFGAAGIAAWMKCVRWLDEFGAVWHQPDKFRPIRWMLGSPEYSWPEKLRFTKAAIRSFELLYDDLVHADLSTSCPELAVPVFMAVGRFDRMAPPEVAERYSTRSLHRTRSGCGSKSRATFPNGNRPTSSTGSSSRRSS
jgi:pimeloyl-ACP methyl ester carboxylesterase